MPLGQTLLYSFAMSGRDPTTIAIYPELIAAALRARDIDPSPIFREVGISPEQVLDPMRRIRASDTAKLFQSAVRLSKNPYLGIDVGKVLRPGQMHAYGFALLSSSTIRDLFLRVQKYFRMVSEDADFDFVEVDGCLIVAATNISEYVCEEVIDVWAVLLVNMLRMISEGDLVPEWVELSRNCPASGDGPYREFFGCPVKFDCKTTRVAISSVFVDRRLPAASEELALHHDHIVMGYLDKLNRADIVTRVRKLIVDDLASGNVSNASVAARLNMSTRNMQLKLAAEGESFQDILDSCRQELAMSYISQSGLAITEIAHLLGFSDASNFTRAFRRWTGISPREFRLRAGIEKPGRT